MTSRKNKNLILRKTIFLLRNVKKNYFFFVCRSPPREGAYVNGLFMEGARWDTVNGTIADSKMKDLFPAMPVIFIKAVTQDKQDVKNVYLCPVYKIR